jgi:hypothetical protein
LIYRRGTPPDAVYAFKHALVQDAAYGTLLRGVRQQLHARVVTVLEAEAATTQPEILAHHCTEGGLVERAVEYWFGASEHALRASANVEAIEHLSRGLQSLQSLPRHTRTPAGGAAVSNCSRSGLHGHAGIVGIGGGAGIPACRRTVPSRRQQRRALQDHLRVVGRSSRARGNPPGARVSDELLRLAEQENDDDLRLQAHHAASPRCWSSEFDAAGEHTERGLALYYPAKHGAHALTYTGHDPGVCAWHRGLNLCSSATPNRPLRTSVAR